MFDYTEDVLKTGICVFNMCHIVLGLIKSGYFSIENLNNQNSCLTFGNQK